MSVTLSPSGHCQRPVSSSALSVENSYRKKSLCTVEPVYFDDRLRRNITITRMQPHNSFSQWCTKAVELFVIHPIHFKVPQCRQSPIGVVGIKVLKHVDEERTEYAFRHIAAYVCQRDMPHVLYGCDRRRRISVFSAMVNAANIAHDDCDITL